MSDDRFHMRVTPLLKARIERMAQQRNTTMAAVVRTAVVEATKGERGIPDEREVLELLSEQARTGNVSAMKELRAYHRERSTAEADPLDRFDELAARRSAEQRLVEVAA
jgi:hypothetical protein